MEERNFILVLFILFSFLCFGRACDRDEFVNVDCSKHKFIISINQTCFDQHWNRGDDWTETIYLGNDRSNSSDCNFGARNQSSSPFEVLFSDCDVKTSYPDPADMEKIKFELNGIVQEKYNLNGNMTIDSPFDLQCEYESSTSTKISMQINSAAAINIAQNLALDVDNIPAPSICVESSYKSNSYDCNKEPMLGLKLLIDYPSNKFSDFRINQIWTGAKAGEKTIKLVDDGCALFQDDLVESHGRSFYWKPFTFNNAKSFFLTIHVTLCDPNDSIFCTGTTDCSKNQGNEYLFNLLPQHFLVMGESLSESYKFSVDDSTQTAVSVTAPSDVFTKFAPHAIIKDMLYIFGGESDPQKIASSSGWSSLTDFPHYTRHHFLIGLSSGNLLLAGGVSGETQQKWIWLLKNNSWTELGNLQNTNYYGTAKRINNSIFIFPGTSKFIEIDEPLEEKWVFEKNPYEYIISNVPEKFRKNVKENFQSEAGVKHSSCPFTIRSSNKTQKSRFPDVLGIGMAKCGTGSLSFLGCHPQIVYTHGELRFFSNPSNAQKILEYSKNTTENTAQHKLNEYKFNALKQSYLLDLRPAADDEILIETSPQYAMSSSKEDNQITVMGRRRMEIHAMKALNPKIKVIVVLCDPIKRAFSGISMHVRNNKKMEMQSQIDEFTVAVEEESNEARAKVEFVDVISPFQEILGEENVLILDGELAIKDPNEGYGQILDFLGLEKEGFELEIDAEKGFPCLIKPAKKCLKDTKGTSRKIDVREEYPKDTAIWTSYFKPFMESLVLHLNLCSEINEECCSKLKKEGALFSFAKYYVCDQSSQ
ncbi:Oidioi.mRNA.OKI2018_I69.chr1.g3688.t1.cds [Oikopleura dioica]|uniref:Oidioi.mRNA.OKI2018_I69.chr1.g3688.t1.cds n=1 Tax=Oikopleura dioica TaxID=34765 RepID=A0ABN7T1S7_OIKDI|nr:Oidioi.mRNA.OKI2018_I69.chr1.g3688.t1.cds [Oikopleura dioica]